MSIDADLVKRLARLARLGVSDAEAQALAGDLGRFLAHAEQIAAVPLLEGDPELVAVAGRPPTPLRQDRIAGEAGQEDALANAPRGHEGFFVVPRVLE